MFTITRTGHFDATLIPGTAHCGIKEPRNRFRYEVTLAVDNTGRDENGFVVDNGEIQRYFDQTYGFNNPTSRSCEEMAYQAARECFKLLGRRVTHCAEIRVKIWGIPTAFIEYHWRREESPAAGRTTRRRSAKEKALAA